MTHPATNTVYNTGSSHPERRGVTGRSVIEAANEAVTVEEIASAATVLKKAGDRLRGRCPVHRGENPSSFSVSPSEQLWRCHSCQEGGDAVRLAKLLGGHERDDQAAAELLLERGLEIPARPQAWFDRQARRKPARDAIGRVKAQVLRRRYFRYCILPIVEVTTHADERDAEVRRAWEDFSTIPDAALVHWYEQGKLRESDGGRDDS